MTSIFRVRSGSGEPIYQQIVRQVKQAVASGGLRSGAQLPTVRDLAVDLVVNPNTVARAYRELERDGVVETTQGRGTFVALSPPPIGPEERRRRLRPFVEQLVAEARTLGVSAEELRAELDGALGAGVAAGNPGDAA